MFSGLRRGFDLTYASNRFVLFLTPVVGAVAGAVTLIIGDGWGNAVGAGISGGGASFLAWTVARELHPDRPSLAAAAFLAAPWGLLMVRPDLLASAVVLVVTRIVAGTTGRGVGWIDVVWVSGLCGLALWRPAALAALGVGAVAVLAVAAVGEHDRRATATLGVVLAGLAFAAPAVSGAILDPAITPILIGGGLAGVVALFGPRGVASATDDGSRRISRRRVWSARLVATGVAFATSVVADPATLAPVWAALAATALRPT